MNRNSKLGLRGFVRRLPQVVFAVAVLVLLISARPLSAIPVLQLYVEGATYDSSTETWLGNFSSGDTIRLWAIGNISGPGGKGTISDVRLSVAYDVADTPTISISSSATGGLGDFTDPSTPSTATFVQTKTDGSVPKLSDGSNLPSHGEYGSGVAWSEYALGNFTLSDSPSADFITSFPTAPFSSPSGSQINVYEITITGTDAVHFDLYNSVQSKKKARAKFAPFSHDAGGHSVPEGGATIVLLGIAVGSIGMLGRKLHG